MKNHFIIRLYIKAAFYVFLLIIPSIPSSAGRFTTTTYIRKATVKILNTSVNPDYCNPWKMKSNRRSFGSGVIIRGNLILTNAHVVSNSSFLQVQRENDPALYDAGVVYISHESDLALIRVKDTNFYRGTKKLGFGGLPRLRSSVATYGYPVGGERISITEGVVSRIEIGEYAHDDYSEFLMIQTDAAINPGNSGGPVIQNGKIVGIAFQVRTKSANIGYMIPVPLIRHFLDDVKDRRYDGFPSLGTIVDTLQSESYRKYLGLGKNLSGVKVTHVIPGGSSEKLLRVGDVLIRIENRLIANDGSIRYANGRLMFNHLVSMKQVGEKIRLLILRNRKKLNIRIRLKKAQPRVNQFNEYGRLPRYVIFGGIVFQPLSKNYIKCWGDWNNASATDIIYYYSYHVVDRLSMEKKTFIVVNRVLPDRANAYISDINDRLVTEINGIKINRLEDVMKAMKNPRGGFHIINLQDVKKPLLLKKSDLPELNRRIMKKYNIRKLNQLNG